MSANIPHEEDSQPLAFDWYGPATKDATQYPVRAKHLDAFKKCVTREELESALHPCEGIGLKNTVEYETCFNCAFGRGHLCFLDKSTPIKRNTKACKNFKRR